jgi:hypothetical protein
MASSARTAGKVQSVGFVLLGIAIFLLKRHYAGPIDDMVSFFLDEDHPVLVVSPFKASLQIQHANTSAAITSHG